MKATDWLVKSVLWICLLAPVFWSSGCDCSGAGNGGDDGNDNCLFGAPCGGVCCLEGEVCRDGKCQPSSGECANDEECQEDSYCDKGTCIPYGTGPRDDTNPNCTRVMVAGLFQPALQCEWTGAPAGDPYPSHFQVLGTPVVADFDLDNDKNTVRPSIVFNSYDGDDGDSGVLTTLDGVLRIIDGQTCELQFSLGPALNGCNSVAVGDLDGDPDGRPEIVAHRNDMSLIAYKFNAGLKTWETLWTGHNSAGQPVVFLEADAGWGSPSLVDLNDDGSPEVLSGGLIYDANGVLLDSSLGVHALFGSNDIGFPVAADFDLDNRVELAGGNGVWEFDPAGRKWVAEWTKPEGMGYTAVADFGTYGADPAQDDRTRLDGVPEVAVVLEGFTRIDTLAGRTAFGPIALPASEGGGPPTIGDFDGDGRAELAAAASDSMTIFDPDCRANPEPASCPTLNTNGILWSQPSQDHSSNITGSSLFDFEGDGVVEAVYADECFVRVYRGTDGKVVYSQWRSSCTWNENPIVADVDGDFTAELVVPSNGNCQTAPQKAGNKDYDRSPGGRPMDPLFAGLPCQSGADCINGACDSGLCRCTADAECGGGGFVCAPPPAGTPGAGNSCRAEWQGSIHGVRVYHDMLDRWVGSRPIWNQHAYAVSNVAENGKVPRTSDAQRNWQVPGLNNFRQNIQGDLNPSHSPDLTAGQGGFDLGCAGNKMTLRVRICNRGTYPIAAGVHVGFFNGDPSADGKLVCDASTVENLAPGACEVVSCSWLISSDSTFDLTVVADYDKQRTECLEGNNRAMIRNASCPPL